MYYLLYGIKTQSMLCFSLRPWLTSQSHAWSCKHAKGHSEWQGPWWALADAWETLKHNGNITSAKSNESVDSVLTYCTYLRSRKLSHWHGARPRSCNGAMFWFSLSSSLSNVLVLLYKLLTAKSHWSCHISSAGQRANLFLYYVSWTL